MSYCRFGWMGSDVYVFEHVDGGIECCGCLLQSVRWVDDPGYPIFKGYLEKVAPIVQTRFMTRSATIAHLREHQAKGHSVPDSVFEELRYEIETEGDDLEGRRTRSHGTPHRGADPAEPGGAPGEAG